MTAAGLRARATGWPPHVAVLAVAALTAAALAAGETPSPEMVASAGEGEGLALRVAVPLLLRIPSLQVDAPVLGVGITPANVMAAPSGPAGDPVWGKAFWYRGGGIPGDVGTATIAGHVDDVLGRPAAFARLEDLHVGDTVVVHDTRNGLDVTFVVTETETYSTAQTSDPAVLARLYGAGPVAGTGPEPAADGLSHLVLITCAGTWGGHAYDHRLAVFAQRAG